MAAPAMDDLAVRYGNRGVTSVFVYTREAHPGERYRHHRLFEEKRANALAFVEHSSVRRKVLLDDLEGTVHHAYGLLPNMTWIVGPGGRILYKAMWTDAGDVESALDMAIELVERRRPQKSPEKSPEKSSEKNVVPFYTERLALRVRDDASFRAGLERTGPQAVRDFYGEETDDE